MKRLLLLVCAMAVLASPAWGGGLLIGSGVVASGGVPVNVGDETQNETERAFSSYAYTWFFRVQGLPESNGTLKSITVTVKGSGSTQHAKFALYTDDGGSPYPSPANYVANSATEEATIASTTTQDLTLDVAAGSPAITSGTRYWIALSYDSSDLYRYTDTGGTGTDTRIMNSGYASFPPASFTNYADYGYLTGKAYFTYE